MNDVEQILLITYAILGPLAWLAMMVLMLFGRRRMSRLIDPRFTVSSLANTQHVTIVIPAKDEGAGIRECLERCLAQDHDSFDVIAVDDRSTDHTGPILDEFARSNAKLRVLHVRPGELPEGWLGKCNALHRACREITSSRWILFVDSDVKLQPHALSHALSLAVNRNYDALSILTRLECHSFLEELMLPLLAGSWAVMFTVSLTNEDSKPHIAAANGQFFLIRREAYESVGGHGSVRDQIVEDVELMRLLKTRGFKTRLMLGSHLATTRMHSTLSQMRHGWGRIYSGTARRRMGRIIAAMLFIIVCGLSVYPMLMWSAWSAAMQPHRAWDWLTASIAHFAIMTLYLAMIYRGSGNRARFALLFPIAAGLMMRIFAFALKLCRTGRVTWRGSEFAAGAPPSSAPSLAEPSQK